MERTIHFLSGLPRTGSTLLGSILAQNPCVHVTPTSPLAPLIMDLSQRLCLLAAQHTFNVDTLRDKLFAAVPTFYFEEFDKPFIFDKNRFWPEHVESIKRYINPEPRIIATIRPIAEIVTSWIKLCNRTPDNFIDNHIKHDEREVNNDNRASLIWQKYLAHTHGMLNEAIGNFPENILLVEYDDIVYQPHQTLSRIYHFCDLPHFRHSLTGIENRCAESKDEAWGMAGLHDIRPDLNRQSDSPEDHLSPEAIEYLTQFDIRSNEPCRANS